MKKILFLTTVLAGFTLASCEFESDGKKTEDYGVKEFIEEFSNTQTVSVISSELPKTYTLEGGSKITVEPGTFTKNGNPVTGNITLEVKEILKRSDMIFSGTNTNHKGDGYPLLSDGFLYINAKHDGVDVDKTLAKDIRIEIVNNSDRFYTELWTGTGEPGEDFAWQSIDSTDQTFGIEGKNIFAFNIGKLGWFNCDIYWNISATKTTVTVNIAGVVTGSLASFLGPKDDIFVFFCAKGDNVISSFTTVDGANSIKSYEDSMPEGFDGKIFVVIIKDGRFYYDAKNITITANLTVILNPAEQSKSYVQGQIEDLDNFN